jgi:hypothetical protein
MRGRSYFVVLVSVLGVGAYRSSSSGAKDTSNRSGSKVAAVTDARSEGGGLAETFTKFDRLRKFEISNYSPGPPQFAPPVWLPGISAAGPREFFFVGSNCCFYGANQSLGL